MNYKPRLVTERLHRLLDHFPIVVISGARQVGKTTLAAHALPHWQSVVFDPSVDVGNARADPDLFLDNHPPPLVLDEIQFAPELVAALKRRVDQSGQPGQYVLTGSQQWSVLKTASESLAGRAVFVDLESFSLSEIGGAASAEHWLHRYLADPGGFAALPASGHCLTRTPYEQLWRGFLPEADGLHLDLVGEFHRAYVRTSASRAVTWMSPFGLGHTHTSVHAGGIASDRIRFRSLASVMSLPLGR